MGSRLVYTFPLLLLLLLTDNIWELKHVMVVNHVSVCLQSAHFFDTMDKMEVRVSPRCSCFTWNPVVCRIMAPGCVGWAVTRSNSRNHLQSFCSKEQIRKNRGPGEVRRKLNTRVTFIDFMSCSTFRNRWFSPKAASITGWGPLSCWGFLIKDSRRFEGLSLQSWTSWNPPENIREAG